MKYLIKCKKCDEVGVCTSCGLCDKCHEKKSLTDMMDELTQFTLVGLLSGESVHDVAMKSAGTTFEALVNGKMEEAGVREGFETVKDAVVSIMEKIHEHVIHIMAGRVLFEDDEDEPFCRKVLADLEASEEQIEEVIARNKANSETSVDVADTVVDFINGIGGE